MMRFTVVGGMKLDIRGIPLYGFTLRDSNVGQVEFSPGGVGRNIAGCLARMGGQVSLVTVLRRDSKARVLRASCKAAGISLAGPLSVGLPTSVYLCIHDESGDMIAAVNDMRIMDMLTPGCVKRLLPMINNSDVCVIDTNVPEETINFIAENARIPLLADPVSCAKAPRLTAALHRIHAVKPNLLEALALSGKQTPDEAASWLLERGVKQVFISMGAGGVYYADTEARGTCPAIPVKRGTRTGAGDAMCAGIAMALAHGMDTPGCAEEGCRRSAEHLMNSAWEVREYA